MSDLWQHRWENFVDLLTQYLQAGEESDALLARIAGKRVVWTGHLENTDLDELAPNVYINLPSRVIEFGDGRKATVDGISLPIAQGSQSAWASVQPGAQVKFQAIIGRGES